MHGTVIGIVWLSRAAGSGGHGEPLTLSRDVRIGAVDETYVKVARRWRSAYRAIDQYGQIIDVYVSARRDAQAARRFFTTAFRSHGEPTEVEPCEPKRPFGGRNVVRRQTIMALLRGIAGFWTDYLWFAELHQTGVWKGLLGTKVLLAVVFSAVFFVVLWAALFIADRIAPKFRPELTRPLKDLLRLCPPPSTQQRSCPAS
jgi:hypothetical protein